MINLHRRTFLRTGGLALAGAWLSSTNLIAASDHTVQLVTSEDRSRAFFHPIGLRVPSGTEVTWLLSSGIHTVTAYHSANGSKFNRIPEGAEPWDSGYLMEPGMSFHHRFVIPGVYDYFCRPHEKAGMVGRIVVTPFSGEAYNTDALPDAVVRALPSVSEILKKRIIFNQPSKTL